MSNSPTVCDRCRLVALGVLAVVVLPAFAQPQPNVKWSQPPEPAYPQNVCIGWNEESTFWDMGPTVADDWVCSSEDPIIGIRWWGSFMGWKLPTPPPQSELPSHFHILFWTDVPADPTQPGSFSHPGHVIHEILTTDYTYTIQFDGWDYDPRTGEYEARFVFEQQFERWQWFFQPPSGGDPTILWVSVSACYMGVPPPTAHPFGWLTRPRDATTPALDDAVVITDPHLPMMGSAYNAGHAITYPDDVSWDVSFQLIARSMFPAIKWSQPHNPQWPGLHAHDWASGPAYQGIQLADQWQCQGGEVTRLVWYGNYELDALGREIRGGGVDRFQLSIHANAPGTPWCLPGPAVLTMVAPFNTTAETYTGVVNNEGSRIYQYRFDLPSPFGQQPGEIYWLDITALSVDPVNPPYWRWQEAGREMTPILCPAAERTYPMGTSWQSIAWPNMTHTDLAFDILSTFFGELYLKWDQPPQPYVPDNAFNGWDELSVYGPPTGAVYQIVADDWVCTTDAPVTDIHWWGSFINWWYPWAPPRLPDAFHIGIWTDVPASTGGFSHPGTLIHAIYCDDYTMEFVGWDHDPRLDPRPGPPEATFKFTQIFDPDEYFWQGAGDNIYWVSIAAVYADPAIDHPFGCKTRPRDVNSPAPDDAVVILDPGAPVVGDNYVSGFPLEYPAGTSWDIAFELTSEPIVPPLHPKWTQPPHDGGQGFDAASDLAWPEPPPKWEQLPDVNWPGLHAHDYVVGPGYARITLADDWVCHGGNVTKLEWWGNYEIDSTGNELRGAGINRFHLSLHMCAGGTPFCLPLEPELSGYDVPLALADEQPTGLVNNEGSQIYHYEFVLPTPFEQSPQMHYWFDILAISNDPVAFPHWRWQEANRSLAYLGWAPAAEKTEPPVPGTWQTISWPTMTYSDLAFRLTSITLQPSPVNKVVADDFISNGRPIKALTWWGSYLDELYSPLYPPVEPYVLDGWLISFHHHDPDATCPPEPTAIDRPTVLGVYYAPVHAVTIAPLWMADCFGHTVCFYAVDLDQCCLLCSEVDPRPQASPPDPARPGAFRETRGLRYWLDIQAVVGVTWLPPDCAYDDRILTGHLPSPNTVDGHFWGWHTSPGQNAPWPSLETACTGEIAYFGSYPPDCWDYGNWVKQPWLCPHVPPPPPVQMSFELYAPLKAQCLGDSNCDGVINWRDIDFFVAAMNDNVAAWEAMFPYPPPCPFANNDVNQDGTVNWRDIDPFVALMNTVCP